MKTPRLALAALAPLLAFCLAAPAENPAAPKIGAAAPDFTLAPAAGGEPVALKDLLAKSKAVVVVFDATKCPYADRLQGARRGDGEGVRREGRLLRHDQQQQDGARRRGRRRTRRSTASRSPS